jgi:hypothetical protein
VLKCIPLDPLLSQSHLIRTFMLLIHLGIHYLPIYAISYARGVEISLEVLQPRFCNFLLISLMHSSHLLFLAVTDLVTLAVLYYVYKL